MSETSVMVKTRTVTGTLKGSADRKTAEAQTYRKGKGWTPKVHNAFGLPQVLSCPGATYGPGGCAEGCYVHSAGRWPSVRALLAHNYALLLAATLAAKIDLLTGLLAGFLHQWDRHGDPTVRPIYRIHWSGDFYDREYAEAWAAVIRAHPGIDFWAYTRSFHLVDVLVGIPNLTLYLSADPVNVEAAEEVAAHYGLPVAYMGLDMPARAGTRFGRIDCPETTGRIPMVDADGKGACATCRACIRGNRDIAFKIH